MHTAKKGNDNLKQSNLHSSDQSTVKNTNEQMNACIVDREQPRKVRSILGCRVYAHFFYSVFALNFGIHFHDVVASVDLHVRVLGRIDIGQ
jgi:hypothetical protein